jgi:hypothetical protein
VVCFLEDFFSIKLITTKAAAKITKKVSKIMPREFVKLYISPCCELIVPIGITYLKEAKVTKAESIVDRTIFFGVILKFI